MNISLDQSSTGYPDPYTYSSYSTPSPGPWMLSSLDWPRPPHWYSGYVYTPNPPSQLPVLPMAPPVPPMAEEYVPFVLCFIAAKCAGCGNKYTKPVVPPYDVCVQHREWRTFTPSGGTPQSVFQCVLPCQYFMY